MHKLDRTDIPSPPCLARYRHGVDDWDDLSDDDHQEIRAALNLMQGRICGYCECDLGQHGQHIEHFRQRSRHPQGTFDWNNLFWSCTRRDSCGKHKDTCGTYDHTELIKPDEEDPEDFFLFVFDGSIAIREGLTNVQRRRAQETLRIFNLDAQWGPLRNMRKQAVMGYTNTAQEIKDIAAYYPPEEWMPFLEDELERICELPFCTAIKHFLTPQGAR